MKRSLLTAMVVYCIVSPVWGSNAPTSIPMGYQALDFWATAMSPCSLTIMVQSTNQDGGLNTCGMFTNNISFGSYGGFLSYMTSNGLRLFNSLIISNSTDVRFRVEMTYTGFDDQGVMAQCTGLSVDTDIGPTTNVSWVSFYVVPTLESVVMPLGNVTSATIQSGTNDYVALPLAGTNGIVLNNPYIISDNDRLRLSLTWGDGETAIYTQNGNQIVPPTLIMFWVPAMPTDTPPDIDIEDYDVLSAWYEWLEPLTYNSYNLFISGSYGADTVVESTTDFVTWTKVMVIPWDSWQNELVIPISTDICPLQAFRARSY